jgi:hypothetical protein
VSIVIGWVDAPLVATVGVVGVSDSVRDKVSHARVYMLHVHLHTEAAFTFSVSTLSHMFKEFQVFFHAGVSPRRVNLLISALTHLLSRLEAHVSFALLDEFNSQIKELLEIV